MIDEIQRERLIQLFLNAAIPVDGRTTLLNAMPEILRAALPHTQDSRILLNSAIDICERDGHRFAPPAISQFILKLTIHAPGYEAELESLAARLSILPVRKDPYLDIVIRGSMPFLDRQPLRIEVRKLLHHNTFQPILVINGQTRLGKSFTTRYIDHLARSDVSVRACPIEIDPNDQPTVLDIARDMMTGLGGTATNLTHPDVTNAKRWPKDLANAIWDQVLKSARESNRTWVLILDGIGRTSPSAASKIDEQAAAFVLRLATLVRDNADQHRHRLILIEYDVTALIQFQSDMREISLGALSASDARIELNQLFKELGRDAESDALATAILDKLPDPITDMGSLGSLCSKMMESIV